MRLTNKYIKTFEEKAQFSTVLQKLEKSIEDVKLLFICKDKLLIYFHTLSHAFSNSFAVRSTALLSERLALYML